MKKKNRNTDECRENNTEVRKEDRKTSNFQRVSSNISYIKRIEMTGSNITKLESIRGETDGEGKKTSHRKQIKNKSKNEIPNEMHWK